MSLKRILKTKLIESYIRVENNPHRLTHANGEAGKGIYFSLSQYPKMIQYYKDQSSSNARIIKAIPKSGTTIIDLTKSDELNRLISFMKKEIEQSSKEQTFYVKPKINKSTYQRFPFLIMQYLNEVYPNIDAYIVNHEFKGSLPKRKQLVIKNEKSFDYIEIE